MSQASPESPQMVIVQLSKPDVHLINDFMTASPIVGEGQDLA